ncbi:MAG: phosphoglycerate kinase, partial [Clostridia bacterium]|nr:phosphoglycerate kinase [Clostridia bacterium]
MSKRTVRDLDVNQKTVLVRVDFNVPIKGGEITDDTRIVKALPTINYLIEHGAKVVLFSHLGKIDHKDPVKLEEGKKKNNMAPVAVRLAELVSCPVVFVPETRGEELENAVKNMEPG